MSPSEALLSIDQLYLSICSWLVWTFVHLSSANSYSFKVIFSFAGPIGSASSLGIAAGLTVSSFDMKKGIFSLGVSWCHRNEINRNSGPGVGRNYDSTRIWTARKCWWLLCLRNIRWCYGPLSLSGLRKSFIVRLIDIYTVWILNSLFCKVFRFAVSKQRLKSLRWQTKMIGGVFWTFQTLDLDKMIWNLGPFNLQVAWNSFCRSLPEGHRSFAPT